MTTRLWLRLSAVFLVLLGVASPMAGQAPAPAARKVALVGGMLLDGYEAPPLHHATVAVRDGLNTGAIAGPRMSMSGPWITRNGGGMTDQFGGIAVSSTAQAAREVEKLAAAGVDVIKAHSGLTRDDYKTIADTAHKHDIRVHAHVYAEEDVRNALETGIDVLSHAGSAGTAPPYSSKLITDIVNAGRPVVITAAHRPWVYPDTAQFPERLPDPQLRKDFTPAIYGEIQRSLENWRALGKPADIMVVRGNPLSDIVALSQVERVLKGGVVYKGAAPERTR